MDSNTPTQVGKSAPRKNKKTLATKNVFLLRPIIAESEGNGFGDILSNIKNLPEEKRIVEVEGLRYILNVQDRAGSTIVVLQELKTDELPKVADEASGANEENLEIPKGKSLSYKNIFVYKTDSNLLGMVKLSSCPQNGKLRYCIVRIARQQLSLPNFSLQFGYVFKDDLRERVKNAKSITFAEFTSSDYAGNDVAEEQLTRYREFVAGQGYTKTIKLKGKKGQSVKHLIKNFLDDFIAGNDIPEFQKIQLNLDGESITFDKYYKKYEVDVLYDKDNEKYIDYSDLEGKIIGAIDNYEV